MENKFDVIVIGSGMGGMTAASLLAQFFNKRVLVVERHSTFGGLTHEFSRGESSFEVGVHLIGDMEKDSDLRKIFDAVTGSRIKMQKLPNYYDTFIYPLIQLKVDSDPEQYKSDLIKLFPDEANAIKYYFKDVRSYTRLLTFMMMRRMS